MACPRWLRSALPGVVIDAPDEERGRRDRARRRDDLRWLRSRSAPPPSRDTWQMHAALAARRGPSWSGSRRSSRCTGGARHPAAVGIGVGAVVARDPHGLPARTSPPPSTPRSGLVAVTWPSSPGSLIAWAFASPLLYPRAGSYWVNAGACRAADGRRARLGTLRTRAARARAIAARARSARGRARRGRRPARPSGGASRARCTTCSPTASRCSPCTPARSSSTPTHRPRRSPRRPASSARARRRRSRSCAA